MIQLIRLIAVALAFGFALGACGQKGPLYLPGDPSEIRIEAPEQEDDEDEDETDEQRPR